jgi:phosphatidate cytidylyltransferase
MPDADPVRPQGTSGLGGGGLAARIGSALVLAPLALLFAYIGAWPFELFWGIAALIVVWEWTTLMMRRDQQSVVMTGAVSVALALMLAGSSVNAGYMLREMRYLAAIIVLAMGMLVVWMFAPRGRRAWLAVGIPYAGALGLAPIILRVDDKFGFLAIAVLFAVVWATDIAAFFTGRAVGGPKLASRLSPNKTWAGAAGGVVGGAIAAIAVAMIAGLGNLIVVTSISIILSICAQFGDLFESALKRRFGVKDSSRLIPGHGGLMDRLDGFVAAAALACVIGLVRGGVEAPAQGFLVW